MFVLASTAIVYCFPRIFIRINMPEEDKSEISSPIFEYEWMVRRKNKIIGLTDKGVGHSISHNLKGENVPKIVYNNNCR